MFSALRQRTSRCTPIFNFVNSLSTSSVRCSDTDDKNSAKAKLQDLLLKLANENKSKIDESSKIPIARPVKRVIEKRPTFKIKLDKIEDKHTAKLIVAVKDVADHVGGDIKATEAELLHVVLNNKKPGKEDLNLENVITGMKVEVDKDRTSRASQVRRLVPDRKKQFYKKERNSGVGVDIFNQKPLDIFPDGFKGEPKTFNLKTWQALAERDLKLQVTHPPSNIFEEMISWTNQGKLWKFPIDNEQGLEEEKKIDFTQHVFLDEHLEPWCPPKGPIRHFMELVLIGLSKNPHITVEAKIENIHWFRDYFESKKKILEDVGALPTDSKKTQITSS